MILNFEPSFFGVVYNLDFGGVGVWNCFVNMLSHFVDDRLSFVTSIRECQCDDCWWCFCVGVSGFIVGVGGLIVRVCFFSLPPTDNTDHQSHPAE